MLLRPEQSRPAPKPLIWAYHGLRIVVAAVFIAAGAAKLPDLAAFADVIGAYGLLPEALLPFAALGFVTMEIAAGIGLLLEIRGSLRVLTGLLVLFLAVLAYAVFLGLDVDCGCYGPGDPEADAFHDVRGAMIRDVAYLTGIGLLTWYRKKYGVVLRLPSFQRLPLFTGVSR